ncbi:hypothetical protein F4780DRAFT_100643 [Xylariomycetidae sp. FL0641]|nr:hypothetical protein F4780DRAFT_100643 [Xylariomycetidae sp. FL0641]
MAANMPQMGGGQMRPPRPHQQQLSQLIYQQLVSHPIQTNGWQNQVPIQNRVGNTMNLITNSFLAMPQEPSQVLVSQGMSFERDAYVNAPDKATYDNRIGGKIQELFKRRQANEQNLHQTLNAQQTAQFRAQAQAQAHLMMNHNMQMNGMGQPQQQNFQRLQQQMQPSLIPQQGHQLGMGMGGAPGMPMNNNQQAMQMGGAPMRQPGIQLAQLSAQDKAKVTQVAIGRLNQTPEAQKNQIRTMMAARLPAHQMQQLQQENVDPVLYFFQTQILAGSKGQNNANPAAMQMQAQQRQMNQPVQQNPGAVGNEFGPFSNVEIMNQQKAGLMAQEAGQMVVPASSGPGRNATPQPGMGGMPGPNQGGAHPGAGQGGMQHQRSQQFSHGPTQQMKMDQMAAQTQAQIRAQAQAKTMQGQPGGLNGMGGVSQSPAMNTLNTPVHRSPMGMGPDGHPQMGQGNMQFGQMMDPRFNQATPRPPMGGNLNRQQILNAMLGEMPPESRAQVMSMPIEKVNGMISKWYAAKTGGQMQGRPQPQPGQFGQGNPMVQFNGNVNGGQQPNQNQQQQQMMLQQQINRLRGNMQGPNSGQLPPQMTLLMDSMDVPPKILEQMRNTTFSALPPSVKKWNQLKQWFAQNQIRDGPLGQLLGVQQAQFANALKRNPALAAAASQRPQPDMPPPGGQAPNGAMPPQSVQPTPIMDPAFANITVTPQEIQQAKSRQNLAHMSEEDLRKMLVEMKRNSLRRTHMPGAQVPGPANAQPAPANAPAQIQPPNAPSAPMTQPAQTGSGPVTSGPANAAPARPQKQPQPQVNRPVQNTPVPQKAGVKRPSTDDVVEVPTIIATPAQRPPSQQPQNGAPPFPQLSAQQIAAMPPEQRAKYEAMVKNHQARAAGNLPEEMQRLKAIGQEEHFNAAQEQLQEVPMTPEQYQDMAQKIQAMIVELHKLSKVLGRWYSLTHDNNRARMFFKMRLRLIKQFVDGEKMTTLKDTFTISPKELDGVRNMLESMAKDVAHHFPQNIRKNQQNASDQNTTTRTATPPSQPTPLNAANLEKQAQAIKMHQRSSSKSGQPPAAPTTSQPPFSFGAASPSGQPTYAGKPALTQENLHLPARKRTKTGQPSGLGSGGNSANASPQVQKMGSPDMNKRPAAAEAKQPTPKPQFLCPDSSCEFHTIGFTTEEAQRHHNEEEHIKPAQDPLKFFAENLAAYLGVEPDGSAKRGPADGQMLGAPMSREPSMKRQGSAAGTKAGEMSRAAPGKTGTPRSEPVGKATDVNGTAQPSEASNAWSHQATIDPLELFTNMSVLEWGGNGAISDMNVYRSITPKDTPESMRDSAGSEPTSDVSEGVSLNMNLDFGFDTWRPFEGPQIADPDFGDRDSGDMKRDDFFGETIVPGFTSWDEVHNDFSKPFALDTSLYSLNTST